MAKRAHLCSKTFLFFLNSLFMLFGLATLVLGVYIKADSSYSVLSKILEFHFDTGSSSARMTNLKSISTALVIIGICTMAVAAAGILGACCEIRSLISIYAIIISILVIGLITFGIATIVLKYNYDKHISGKMRDKLVEAIKTEYGGSSKNQRMFTIVMDVVQVYLKCCGARDYTDFNESTHWNRTLPKNTGNATVPITCCRFNSKQREMVLKGRMPVLDSYECAVNPDINNSNYHVGCVERLSTFVDRILLAVLLTTTFFGLIFILGSCASCRICNAMRRTHPQQVTV